MLAAIGAQSSQPSWLLSQRKLTTKKLVQRLKQKLSTGMVLRGGWGEDQQNRPSHISESRVTYRKQARGSEYSGNIWIWSIFIGTLVGRLASHPPHLTIFSKMRKSSFPWEGSGGVKLVLARSMSALLTRSRLSRRDFPGFFGPGPSWGWEDATIGAWSLGSLRTPGEPNHLKPRALPGLTKRPGRILPLRLPFSPPLPSSRGGGYSSWQGRGRSAGAGEGWASERQSSRLHNCSFKCLAPRSRP